MSTLILETLLNASSNSPGGKDYEVTMREDSGQYEVRIAYGPSGRLGQWSPKYMGPDRALAQKTFDSAVKAKLRGSGSSVYSIVHERDYSGSVVSASQVRPTKPKLAKAKSPFECQNLSIINSEDEMIGMLKSGNYLIQAKADGERLSIMSDANGLWFFNKANAVSKVPVDPNSEMMQSFDAIFGHQENAFVDGEVIGNRFYAFDLLSCGHESDMRGLPYLERFTLLRTLIPNRLEYFKLIPTILPSLGFEAQWDFYQKIKGANGEGVVLHDIHSTHEPGKGKNHWKYKFKERSTCIVSSIGDNGLRSVGLQLLSVSNSWADDINLVDVGNCTIPVNYEIPSVGELVDVEYLYKYFDGAFIQPIYKGVRTDVLKEECTLAQVRRYKTGMAVEDMV